MRRIGLVLAAVLMTACGATPAERPELTAAAQSAERAEFTIIDTSRRQMFPTWSTLDLDGYDWNTENLGSRMVVVNIWASWCQPCRDEWPELQAAATSHPSVVFIGINTMDNRHEARRFLKEFPSEYRQLIDDNAFIITSLIGVPNTTLPMTLILDQQGAIAAWKSGPVLKGQLRRVLATLLAQ